MKTTFTILRLSDTLVSSLSGFGLSLCVLHAIRTAERDVSFCAISNVLEQLTNCIGLGKVKGNGPGERVGGGAISEGGF